MNTVFTTVSCLLEDIIPNFKKKEFFFFLMFLEFTFYNNPLFSIFCIKGSLMINYSWHTFNQVLLKQTDTCWLSVAKIIVELGCSHDAVYRLFADSGHGRLRSIHLQQKHYKSSAKEINVEKYSIFQSSNKKGKEKGKKTWWISSTNTGIS